MPDACVQDVVQRQAVATEFAPVSVLMSTYAGERAEHLDLALQSIATQTLPAAEVVLVLDGPVGDAQHAVVESWSDRAHATGSRFVVVDRPRCGGLATALNDGLSRCREAWIARMDSDDYAPSDRLATQCGFLAEHPDVDVLAGYQLEFADDPARIDRVKSLPETHDDIVRTLRWRNTISHPSLMMRASALAAVSGYRDVGLLEDYDLHFRLLATGARFHGLQHPAVHVRVTQAQRARRGGISYALKEMAFRAALYRAGHISFGNLLLSAPGYAAFRLCPPAAKRMMYSLVRHG